MSYQASAWISCPYLVQFCSSRMQIVDLLDSGHSCTENLCRCNCGPKKNAERTSEQEPLIAERREQPNPHSPMRVESP
ncbi:hypothetical protein Hypma_011037 [Hypsizygus marmoreus]|uniref:Uncharacterized protein n=1 Tax=Hypsizygus marmoreus TaxID=39966 RepID=A0A369JIW3_HYPMA|nr:hypothetical protein Hypma_011037 [Hypsizygus marmoreus]